MKAVLNVLVSNALHTARDMISVIKEETVLSAYVCLTHPVPKSERLFFVQVRLVDASYLHVVRGLILRTCARSATGNYTYTLELSMKWLKCIT